MLHVQGGHTCSCPEGFNLDPGQRTCIKAKKVMCPGLKRPKYGFFRCTQKRTRSGYKEGTKCQMKCKKGFKPFKIARKRCLSDSTWEGDDGECRPLTCPTLSQPVNGRVEPISCLTGRHVFQIRFPTFDI